MAKTPTLISVVSFRQGAFFRGVHSDPDPCFHKLFGELDPISQELGEPLPDKRKVGDGGNRVRPIKKTWLGDYFSWIQKGKLSGASPSSDLKTASLSSVARQA
jgi:hypothetical protein